MRKRDGVTITYQYDALNRVTRKTVPASASGAPGYSVFYGYDIRGLQTYARFGSSSGLGILNTYDGFGRLTSSANSTSGVGRTLSYGYDTGSRRSRLTFPDNHYFAYDYDAPGSLIAIRENGGAAIASFTYDNARRRSGTGYAGAATSYGYDPISRLSILGYSLAGTGADQSLGFGYNPASQIVTRTSANDAYASNTAYNVTRGYTVNGLNQYTVAGPANFLYDANGNLRSDGSTTFVYDAENRLVSASGARTAALAYDPLGRLFHVTGGPSGTTRFVYDGDELVAEYNLSGVVLRRYAHGTGSDDPVLWYEGAGLTSRRSLFADHQGSIVAVADAAGNSVAINGYDSWGIPNATNLGRFQYTGQAWIAELGMYYYKARIYSPTLGRFLQTDPVGYDDQINLYAYVGNDPVNATDPSGQMRNCGLNDPKCIETPESAAQPGDPPDVPDETEQTDEIVVTAQLIRRTTDGEDINYDDSRERYFVVTGSTFVRRPLPQIDIPCGNETVTIGRPGPLGAGERAAHMHTNRQNNSTGSVPGSGDNNFGNRPTGYMITSTRVFAMDRGTNGTFRTRILSGAALSGAESSRLIENMRNWESGNSSNRSLTDAQRFCRR